jgi:sugar O-acyltransferase (sialic acid O-acetyltransferase NeuD family)
MKTLAIIGAGDLGQQIAHYALTDKHYNDVIFFDDFSVGKTINGFTVLGSLEDIIDNYNKKKFQEIIIGIGYKHLDRRKELFEQFIPAIPFGKIIHSTVWKDPTSQVMQGCVIYPGCVLDARSVIAENTILNVSCSVAHDTVVGPHCFLSPRVAIAGFVKVEEKCILGINSTIIDNINICANSQLGGGTIVIKNIEKAGLYVGNPSRLIR